jgi:hypothetical protein
MATPDNRKRHILFLVKGVVSVALLFYLLNKIDLAPLAGRRRPSASHPLRPRWSCFFSTVSTIVLTGRRAYRGY